MEDPDADPAYRSNVQEARRRADQAHGRLVELGATVAVAESLTGGLIGVFLTEAPGTSVTFRGGLVVYASDLKESAAGVNGDDLTRYGPVHEVIAGQLASGARTRLGADYGVGVTGVAGPGEQGDSPVGEVHIAIAGPSTCTNEQYRLEGNRAQIRVAAAATALAQLVQTLEAQR